MRTTSLLLLLGLAGLAPAQGPFCPVPGGVAGFRVQGQLGPVQFAFGRYGFGYPAYNPYLGVRSTSVTVLYYTPPPPPTVFVLPVSVPRREPPLRDIDLDDDEPEFEPLAPRIDNPGPDALPLPGKPASVFRPIGPRDRERAREEVPDLAFPPVGQDLLPRREGPLDDPQAEAERLLKIGRTAFAAQEYGRAAEFFDRAGAVDALAVFLLAQARFAQGKYGAAIDAIEGGLKRMPDWPMSPFRARELYGEKPADFEAHLQRLEDALARHRDDPILLFLYGYQLWFDGRKPEALVWLHRAARVAPDRTAIDRFLRVPAGFPVVVR